MEEPHTLIIYKKNTNTDKQIQQVCRAQDYCLLINHFCILASDKPGMKKSSLDSKGTRCLERKQTGV